MLRKNLCKRDSLLPPACPFLRPAPSSPARPRYSLGNTSSVTVAVRAGEAGEAGEVGEAGEAGEAGQRWPWARALSVLSDQDAAGRPLLPPRPLQCFPGLLSGPGPVPGELAWLPA